MKRSLLTTMSLLSLGLAGCGTSENPLGASSPSAAAESGAVGLSTLPAGVYAVDRSHTYLTFSYLHLGYSYPLLRFTSVDGELDWNADSIARSTVAIAIDTDSLDTKLPRFNTELKSLQYFDAERYPKITFTSHSYEPTGATTGRLTGYLTIKGRTHPVSLDVTINNALQHPVMKVPVIGFSATGTLLRSDWGLSRNVPFVADEVNVSIEIEFLQGSGETSAEAAAIATETTAGAPAENLVLSRAGAQ